MPNISLVYARFIRYFNAIKGIFRKMEEKIRKYADFALYFEGLVEKHEGTISRQDLANKLGTNQPAISKIYSGYAVPSENIIDAIRALWGEDISGKVREAKKQRSRELRNVVEVVNRKCYIDERKVINTLKKETEKPRLDLSAIAGLPTEYVEDYSELQPVIQQIPKYDFTIKISGDSMMPEYQSGDEVACLKIRKGEFIQWGKVYVINTSQGAFIKRLYKGDNCYKCVSDNVRYQPFEIPENEVYSINLVVGLLRVY